MTVLRNRSLALVTAAAVVLAGLLLVPTPRAYADTVTLYSTDFSDFTAIGSGGWLGNGWQQDPFFSPPANFLRGGGAGVIGVPILERDIFVDIDDPDVHDITVNFTYAQQVSGAPLQLWYRETVGGVWRFAWSSGSEATGYPNSRSEVPTKTRNQTVVLPADLAFPNSTSSSISRFGIQFRGPTAGLVGLDSLTVTGQAIDGPLMNDDPLPAGQEGVFYRTTVSASGSGELTYRVLTPALVPAEAFPPGLTLNQETGEISGTPTESGTFTFRIQAFNPWGIGTGLASSQASFTIEVAEAPAAPQITSGDPTPATVGLPYLFPLTATSDTPVTWQVEGLPNGLEFEPTTATIGGEPTESGTSVVTVTATNDAGTTTAGYRLFVNEAASSATPPAITSELPPGGTVDTPYAFTIEASGDTPLAFGAIGLPPGLSIDADTGVISGTPTTAGSFKTTITVTNIAGQDVESYDLNIEAATVPLAITSGAPTAATEGQAYWFPLTATSDSAVTWSVTGLPDGLDLDSATGVISGRPTASGTFSLAVQVENAGSDTDTATYDLTVNAAPAPLLAPTITSGPLPDGTVGETYTFPVTATGEVPFTFSATGLPDGLGIDPGSGQISGTPTTPGSFTPTITVTNDVGQSTATYAVDIAPAPVPPTITSGALPDGTVGESYTFTVTADGDSPITYSASNLPTGLTIDPDDGQISGTPLEETSNFVVVTATNAAGSDSESYILRILPAPSGDDGQDDGAGPGDNAPPGDPDPTDPTPTDPIPTDPTPTDPNDGEDPAPTDPGVDPVPADPVDEAAPSDPGSDTSGDDEQQLTDVVDSVVETEEEQPVTEVQDTAIDADDPPAEGSATGGEVAQLPQTGLSGLTSLVTWALTLLLLGLALLSRQRTSVRATPPRG